MLADNEKQYCLDVLNNLAEAIKCLSYAKDRATILEHKYDWEMDSFYLDNAAMEISNCIANAWQTYYTEELDTKGGAK